MAEILWYNFYSILMRRFKKVSAALAFYLPTYLLIDL
jgi:hypothetical protein